MRILAMAMVAGFVGGPVFAQSPTEGLPGTITTHATARGRLDNTIADVSIGVEAHSGRVAATQAALTAAS